YHSFPFKSPCSPIIFSLVSGVEGGGCVCVGVGGGGFVLGVCVSVCACVCVVGVCVCVCVCVWRGVFVFGVCVSVCVCGRGYCAAVALGFRKPDMGKKEASLRVSPQGSNHCPAGANIVRSLSGHSG